MHPRDILLLIFSISTLFCYGQDQDIVRTELNESNSTKHYIGITTGYGFLLAHRASMRKLIQGHTKEIEINYVRKPKNKYYSKIFNNPDVGFTAAFHEVGNKADVGFIVGVYPFIRFPFSHKKNALAFTVGSGLGYVKKPFNQTTNLDNIAIGSYLNSVIHFSVDGKINANRDLVFNYGLGFTHYSNGSFSAPNLGFNIPTLRLGLLYNFRTQETQDELNLDSKPPYFRNYEAYVFGGLREISLHNPNKYFVGSITTQYVRQFNDKLAWESGLDFMYNRSLPVQEDLDGSTGSSPIRGGLFLGIETILDNLSIVINQGVYVYNEYKKNGLLYNRIGARYRANNLIFSAALRSHKTAAEYIEFGVGLRLK